MGTVTPQIHVNSPTGSPVFSRPHWPLLCTSGACPAVPVAGHCSHTVHSTQRLPEHAPMAHVPVNGVFLPADFSIFPTC